jgi:hypothetical protein
MGVFRRIIVIRTNDNMIKTMVGEKGNHQHLSALFRYIQTFRELSSRSYSHRRTKLSFFRKFRYFHSLCHQNTYHGLLFVLLHSLCRMINLPLHYYYPNNNESQWGANEKEFITFASDNSFILQFCQHYFPGKLNCLYFLFSFVCSHYSRKLSICCYLVTKTQGKIMT